MTCRGNSLGEGLELLPVPLHHPLARKHKGWQAPYSAPETWQFISVSGPPVSTESVQEGWQQLAWRGGAPAPSRVQLLPCPTPTCQTRPDSRVRGDTGRREGRAGGQLVRTPREGRHHHHHLLLLLLPIRSGDALPG